MLRTVHLSNFKSISNQPVSLGNFNVLIGANAAGKSNFVDTLRFIHDMLGEGASTAVGRRLGWNNLLTRGKKKSTTITAELLYDLREIRQPLRLGKKGYKPREINYRFEVASKAKRIYLNSETLNARFECNGDEFEEMFERTRQKVNIHSSIGLPGHPKSISVPRQLEDKLFIKGGELVSIGSILLSQFISGWRFYDLDVNVSRTPCVDEGQDILLNDGRNLAAVLDRLKSPSARVVHQRILKIMSILIPGFEKWEIEQQFDGSLGFKVYEKGMTKALLPKMVSDGTIRLLGILLALLYQASRAILICIDEPERYLHPQVLKPIVEVMRDVSKRTQLIVTTHSAEMVKWLEPSEVLMVDKIEGVTQIVRAQDVSMVEKFLEEFTLDELWLGGYLKRGKTI